MDKIQSSLLLSSYQEQKRQTHGDNLGKDDFLKILMTQLQNQDPMNPLEDKDFIAQMATFSTLEQITNMGKSIDKFTAMQQQSQLVSYNQFVGKEVTWHKITESADGGALPNIEEGKGRITSVQFKEDTVQFTLEDGTKLEPGNISEVNQSASQSGSSLMQASELIGKTVTWLTDQKQESTAIVKSVGLKDGKTSIEMDDASGTKINMDQMIKITG
ncbi:flagellar hook assembly protein FlgD [Peribacillus deserti]|uniref:Basal-body rod modification protein FlgD n=1 Tax=Peribacillus deserti TaxID=673318 RepID=A0A2N5MB11_9BACI|nr:flagellar hook assembly protein FlgD [Peribacillus deserti]PLT31550.1 flagellar hook assembly protein FlgD [Peribacillus deserti]